MTETPSEPSKSLSRSDQSLGEESIVYWEWATRKHLDELKTRERLVEAGWRATINARLDEVFPSTTTATVAKEAGVTTGSFFHHFPNARSFANAMVHDLVTSASKVNLGSASELLAVGPARVPIDLPSVLHDILSVLWDSLSTDETNRQRFRAQMLLWTYDTLSFTADGVETSISDCMRATYTQVHSSLVSMWKPILESTGREFKEPFTTDLVTVILFSLFEGLHIRAQVDPSSVPPSLFADACVALVISTTRRSGARVTLGEDAYDIRSPDEDQSPQARSGAQRRRETRARIVAACTGMFAEGWESVSATDVAARSGVSTQTVTNLFGTVRAVAATTFAPQAQLMYQRSIGRGGENPMAGLDQALTDLATLCRSDIQVARALLAERLHSFSNRGRSLSDMDIRLEVPVSGAIGLWLGRMGMRGEEGMIASTTLTDFVISSCVTGDRDSAETIALSKRLLPDEIASGSKAWRY